MARLAESELRLARAHDDVRRFARGIRPRELAEHGLAPALVRLAGDSSLAVHTSVDVPDLPVEVAACAYFVCSEGLANAAKHAATADVVMSVTAPDENIVVVVEDRGIGGADPARGSGLLSLADRVEALGGTVDVMSPAGGGTRLIAAIPRGAGWSGRAAAIVGVEPGSLKEDAHRSNEGSVTTTARGFGR